MKNNDNYLNISEGYTSEIAASNQSNTIDSVILQELDLLEKFLAENTEADIKESATYIFNRVMLNLGKLRNSQDLQLITRFKAVSEKVIKYLETPKYETEVKTKEMVRLEKIEKRVENMEKQLFRIESKITAIAFKLSTQDDIYQIDSVKFYLPKAPYDFIQSRIIYENRFYELSILVKLDKYLNKNSVVLDLGANIGNHTLYWGKITKVSKIFAFEPILDTFRILQKNIEINDLSDKVKIYNLGLGDKTSNGEITTFFQNNIGGTEIGYDDKGSIKIAPLDSIKEINQLPKIDFVKIDVEGFEKNVLNGAINTISKHKPVVFIESKPADNNVNFVLGYFADLGYTMVEKIGENYLFEHSE